MTKIKTGIATLLAFLALNSVTAQTSDSTKADTIKNQAPIVKIADNFNGSFEWVQGMLPEHTYARSNTFYGLPANISGYDWTEFYGNANTTIFGRNTLSKEIAGPLGIDNQFIYGTGITPRTGVGAHLSLTPLKDVFVKPYFTPVLIDIKGKQVPNTSIAGVYAETTINPNLKVSGFYEMNLSAQKGPETSYGELNVEGIVNDNISLSFNPSFTNKGSGVAAPHVNPRFTFKYTPQ